MTLICVPIMENTVDSIFKSAEKCKTLYADLIELRLDCLKDSLSLSVLKELSKLKEKTELPVILTLRPTSEGGYFDKFEERRLDILGDGIELGFDYIDLEFRTNSTKRDALIAKAKKKGIKTIVSSHNLKKTPSWTDILALLEECSNAEADIIKLAYTTNTIEDALNVIKAGKIAKDQKLSFTVMGMGSFGHITRVFAPFIGCKIVYASIGEDKKSIEGQLDIGTLLEFWDHIGYH